MAASDFKNASIRCTFENGMGEDGKLLKKVKSYHHVTETAGATEIFEVATVLTNLGTKPLMFLEKQSAESIYAV
ncbi:DUF1659 domain-containing protein [Planococcus salinus]|uniref:DUF1659 domain-containing protein n=1 Tax=Planococcus salinus TaxID=1848460 RepID=A0A3M8PBM9_9BACL|nr:DUF1659 domain-containing protein [Planococcus salinus]RNF41115.1 DUF1659 domain-containing protein [Planococcus salinus]